MSTKTTFKRIALVTVAALGFGVMSVVPSTATINADSLTLSAATATQTTAETATATGAVVTLSFLGTALVDSASVTASLVSGPAGSTALPFLSITETTSALVDSATAGAKVVGGIINPNTAAAVWARGTADAAVSASAKFRVFVGNDSLTAPAKAGTYVVKLTPATIGLSGALQGATAQTLTITVTAAAALDTVITTATSIITAGTVESGTADAIVTASRSLAASTPNAFANAKANIKITPKNAAGTTVGVTNATNPGESMTAVLTGPGSLGTGVWGTGDAIGRAISVKAGNFVYVYADGNSGEATITISSAAGVVLATEKITFFGAATSITTAVETAVLNPTAVASGANADALAVTVKDAAGVVVSNLNSGLYVTSETTTIVSQSYANSCTFDTTDQVYYCTLTGVAAGKTKITVGTKSSATDATVGAINATAVEVRVGTQTAASVKVTTDKTSYAPGEKATLTVQLLDADGLAVADGVYTSIFATGGITTDFVLGSGSDTTTATKVEAASGAVAVGGKRAFTVYMPQNTGTITFSWTTGGTAVTGTAPTATVGLLVANQAVKGTLPVTVSNPAVEAATVAAEAAEAAAQDATDAALDATTAAEAAGALAQEAVDAVAELSAEVTKLMAALKAQITYLTKLVMKLAAK
jgi:hypothetical protein